jgi:DNA-binding MarR family transcriptional regulator
MSNEEPESGAVAASLLAAAGLLLRRMRQQPVADELTIPQHAALARLDRGGPATAAELARQEQISAQSMGATTAVLQERGLVERRSDPADGRRIVLAVTEAGAQALRDKRNARAERLRQVLDAHFTAEELAQLAAAGPLLERLARHLGTSAGPGTSPGPAAAPQDAPPASGPAPGSPPAPGGDGGAA